MTTQNDPRPADEPADVVVLPLGGDDVELSEAAQDILDMILDTPAPEAP